MKTLPYLLLASVLFTTNAWALTFPLPEAGDNVIGQARIEYSAPGENLSDVAMRTGFGYYELIEANPGIQPNQLKPWTKVNIPGQFILPATTHDGIVINLAELRLYYYPAGKNEVITFPIAIGREGWKTPVSKASVVAKVKDPSWRVPASIKTESARQGIKLPDVVPPGPKNPLGKYAVRLSIPGILLHGTLYPRTVGTRGSHGCMRMYAADIETLYKIVPIGTPVHIVNQPNKFGQLNGKLYIEAHVPLRDQASSPLALQKKLAATNMPVKINWLLAQKSLSDKDGMPRVIGNH